MPGNIQADLEAAHLLKPLWYGAGDPRLYEVARKDWWYRKDFAVPERSPDKRLTLVFDGVDHECEVWLNGKQLGANAGMFRRFAFDVTRPLLPGQVNRLAVRIARMPEEIAPLVARTDGRDSLTMPPIFSDGIEDDPERAQGSQKPHQLGLGLGGQHLDAGDLERRATGGQWAGAD